MVAEKARSSNYLEEHLYGLAADQGLHQVSVTQGVLKQWHRYAFGAASVSSPYLLRPGEDDRGKLLARRSTAGVLQGLVQT